MKHGKKEKRIRTPKIGCNRMGNFHKLYPNLFTTYSILKILRLIDPGSEIYMTIKSYVTRFNYHVM